MQFVEYKCDTCALQNNCGQLAKATARIYKCEKYIDGRAEVQHIRASQSDELQAFYTVGVKDLEDRIRQALKNGK